MGTWLTCLTAKMSCFVPAEIHFSQTAMRVHMISSGRVEATEIQICRRPDGSDWLLGVGGYGKVGCQPGPLWGILAIWGGVLLACHMPSSHCNLGAAVARGSALGCLGSAGKAFGTCLPYTKAPGAPDWVQSILGTWWGPHRFFFTRDEL